MVITIDVTGPSGARRFEFEKAEIIVGSVRGNDLVLPSVGVDKRHARIVRKDGRFILVDLKSSTGTFVNGRRLTAPIVVRAGDHIRIGQFEIALQPEPAARSAFGDDGAVPAFLGKWRVVDRYASGGMSTVYRVVHDATGRRALAKVPRAADPALVERHRREARILARFHSSRIVGLEEAGVDARGTPYLILEDLPRPSLGELLPRGVMMPVEQAARVVRELLTTLCIVHEAGVVHRDVKPDNVFLPAGVQGRVALIDFGISRANGEAAITAERSVLGTVGYMAPEQMQDAPRVDHRADIWSAGVIAYELVSGKLPWSAASPMEYFAAIARRAPIDPPSSPIGPVPWAFANAILRMLAYDPAGRPRDAEEALRLLALPDETEVAMERAAPPQTHCPPTQPMFEPILTAPLPDRAPSMGGVGAPLPPSPQPAPEPEIMDWADLELLEPGPGDDSFGPLPGGVSVGPPPVGAPPAPAAYEPKSRTVFGPFDLSLGGAELGAPLGPGTPGIVLELRAAGFSEVRLDGTTFATAIPKLRARDERGPITLYAAPFSDSPTVREHVDAMEWLRAHPSPLFVPIERRVEVPSAVVFVRRDPVPPSLAWNMRVEVGAALAAGLVTLRALLDLSGRARRFDCFELLSVRAALADPTRFECMLQPPIQTSDERTHVTATGAYFSRDLAFVTPESIERGEDYRARAQLRGSEHAYAAGIVVHALVTGAAPFGEASPYEITMRKVREDPPPIRVAAGQAEIPRDVVETMGGLLARSPRARNVPPDTLLERFDALLARWPEWQQAARRIIERAGPRATVSGAEASHVGGERPAALGAGERVDRWLVLESDQASGDWVSARARSGSVDARLVVFGTSLVPDPNGPEWAALCVELARAARMHPAIPSLLDAGTCVRRVPMAFLVHDETGAPLPATSGLAEDDWLDRLGRVVDAMAHAHERIGARGCVSEGRIHVADDGGIVLVDALRCAVCAAANSPGASESSDLRAAASQVLRLALGRDSAADCDDLEERLLSEASERVGDLFVAAASHVASAPSAANAQEEIERLRVRSRVRAAARQAGSSTVLSLERRFPRPLAAVLRRWRLTDDPHRRLGLAEKIGEVAAELVALVMASAYLATGETSDEGELELAALSRDSTFGAWVARAQRLAAALGARGRNDPVVGEIVESLGMGSGPLSKALERIVRVRNELTHHYKSDLSDGRLDAFSRLLDARVRELLDALRPLAQLAWVYCESNSQLEDESFDAQLVEVVGCAVEPERHSLRSQRAIPRGRTLLLSSDLSSRLVLDPFIVWAACSEQSCGVRHLFVATGVLPDGRVRYLDEERAHGLETLPLGKMLEPSRFEDVLRQRSAPRFRGGIEPIAADAERFWSRDLPVGRGRTLGRFELREEIGAGSMGIVFRAFDLELRAERAIKVIRPELASADAELVRRLRVEARLMDRLSGHEGIARVHGFDTTAEGTSYFVLELLDGGSLHDWLVCEPPPHLDDVRELASRLASALTHVHGAKIVHRDIKPSNVLFDRAGKPKLVDFGVARDMGARALGTIGFAGAPLYAAPEQLAGGDVGPWTDVYALGLVLFDLLVGAPAIGRSAAQRVGELRKAARGARTGVVVRLNRHDGNGPGLLAMLRALVAATDDDPRRRKIPDGLA